MESMAARRRVNMIASHFTTTAYDATATNILFPMNCSSSLNAVIQRRDNKTYFARQGSSSQACFMRQVSTEQGSSGQGGVPLKCTGTANAGSPKAFEAPLFSRQTSLDPKIPNVGVLPPLVHDSKLPATTGRPQFTRADGRINGQKQLCSKTKIHALSSGIQWTPRLDVAESGRIYVVTIELPGVNVNDIRVEVNDKNLTVTGNRTTQWQKVNSRPSDPPHSVYHKREILQGPYQAVWPLPPNVNKDSVSATFADGFLRITFPKL